jgi:hypothetical protein
VPPIELARLPAFDLIAPSQFIDEVLEMGRHAQGIRTQDLLETLAYRVADRAAGLVIERFEFLSQWTFHDPFRVLMMSIR